MRQRGFSLLEMLVAVALLALVVVGFLSMFDMSTRVSKVQSAVADTQDTLRYTMGFLVRYARMAGTGGMPVVARRAGVAPAPAAVIVTNNVPAGTMMPGPSGADVEVLPGTDVLRMRGAFWAPVFDIAGYSYDPAGASQLIVAPLDINGHPQDLTPLREILANGKQIPVMLVATQRDVFELETPLTRVRQTFGIACLTAEASSGTFSFTTASSPTCPDAIVSDMNDLRTFPAGMTNVIRMAPIDDVQAFVALEPGTDVPTLYLLDNPAGPAQPIARDIVDLQVALGCDAEIVPAASPRPARYTLDGYLFESASAEDEWLFNRKGVAEAIDDALTGSTVPMIAYLTEMRITLVTRVPAPEMNWTQPAIVNEDGRDLLAESTYQGVSGARYRYRALTERVKMRSLGAMR